MQTYLNSPDLKTRFLEEIGKHEVMDAVVQGSYGSSDMPEFRGCAIGCALHSLNLIAGTKAALKKPTSDHARYEKELGLPIWLAYLEDNVFENLPIELARTWPRRFAEAVPVGAVVDDVVLAKILRWTLADAEFGMRHVSDVPEAIAYIDAVIAQFDADIEGRASAEQRDARAARAARDARDAWDAWDARDARAARAARDAWDARDARDAWAARAARDAWDARDARDAWDARDARAARAARDAWDARDARDENSSPAGKKAPAFFPAFSEFVLATLRALPTADGASEPATDTEARS